MSPLSNRAIPGSLPVGCCLIARHAIHGVRAFRLIHVMSGPSAPEMGWLVDLDRDAVPTSHPMPELIAALDAGTQESWHWTPRIPSRVRAALSAGSLHQAESAWWRLGPLTGPTWVPALLDANQRGKLLAQRAREIGCGRTQLYRDWSRYLRFGMTPDALIPRIATWCPPPWQSPRAGSKKSP